MRGRSAEPSKTEETAESAESAEVTRRRTLGERKRPRFRFRNRGLAIGRWGFGERASCLRRRRGSGLRALPEEVEEAEEVEDVDDAIGVVDVGVESGGGAGGGLVLAGAEVVEE